MPEAPANEQQHSSPACSESSLSFRSVSDSDCERSRSSIGSSHAGDQLDGWFDQNDDDECMVVCESCRLEMPAELLSCHGCEGCNSSAEVDVQTAVSELCAGLNSQLQLTGDIKATQLQKLLQQAGVSKDEETVKTIMACFGQGPEGRISIEDLAGMKHRKNNADFGARTLAEGG